jgi:aspartate racemase
MKNLHLLPPEMPGSGQKRRFDHAPATSGLPPSTDILRVRRHVQKVPATEVLKAGNPMLCQTREIGRTFMKTIGILGGMSAASTQIYYRELCAMTRERLGGLHSPEMLIRSLDFAKIEGLQMEGDWNSAGVILNTEAKALERGGAHVIVLATNTMHKLASEMMVGVKIPFIHIADATAQAIKIKGLRNPGLMATAFTMEQSFYTDRLIASGLSPIIPNESDRAETHRIIYDELCRDVTTAQSTVAYVAIANRLAASGADSLILGCTEVGMLLNQGNVAMPVFDTTLIHCKAVLDYALE